MGWISGQIGQLMRIGLKIEQLIGVKRAAGKFPTSLTQTDQRRIGRLGGVFHGDRGHACLALPERHQGLPFGPGRDLVHRHTSQITQRRADVDIADRV